MHSLTPSETNTEDRVVAWHSWSHQRSYFISSPISTETGDRLQVCHLGMWLLLQPSLSSRDTLRQLHWLLVKWRIPFKLSSLTYKVLHTGTPSYLSERLHTFLLATCDQPPLLTCTLIFILVHARFILQLQQSGILSLPLFSNFKHFPKTP